MAVPGGKTTAYGVAAFFVGLVLGLFGQSVLSEPTLERLGALIATAGAASVLVGVTSVKGLRDALGASKESVDSLVKSRELDQKRHTEEMDKLKADTHNEVTACKTEIANLRGKLEAYESGAVDALVKAARLTLVDEGVLDERKGGHGIDGP